jgi:predicted metalloprotease with PDZ domain
VVKRAAFAFAIFAVVSVRAQPGTAIRYRLSFPEPQHRWMQVEAVFPGTSSGPLELRMSRSSPGRYSLHDFAKNVYDVHAVGSDGRELELMRPDPYGWSAPAHSSDVTVRYKVFGDRVDGTYLGIDETHAHMNMPATIMWARGYEDRPVELTFEAPTGSNWKIATQLHQRGGVFTAPNLQYLMDSPAEFGPVAMREFTVNDRRFRIAMHHQGSDADLDAFAKDVERVVRQEGAIYGEFPQYEPGSYTFLTDLLPWSSGDGMEHRNSTVITTTATLAAERGRVLDTVAHEFFHCWNVERIRPKGLEPFDFDRANVTDSLWLAEGFTQYYGSLALARAGLETTEGTARDFGFLADGVMGYPGHLVRSAAEMSEMAAFVDGGRPIDRTNWPNSFVSYYTVGGAIALALDLSLRERSGSRVSLDDYMRAMWQKFGRPSGAREGYVDHPYTIAEAQETLASVSGDRAFAHEFFTKYVVGHETADYTRLLLRAGFVLRPRGGARAWMGDLRYDSRGNGVTVSTLVAPNWPVYATGLEEDDHLEQIDGQRVASEADVLAALARHQPGDTIAITFTNRLGRSTTGRVTLAASPHVEAVPVETNGGTPTDAQRAFRDRWLGAKSADR